MLPWLLQVYTGAYRGVWLTNELNELFMTRVTNAPIERLTSELSMCRELLDLEPDNKCTPCPC